MTEARDYSATLFLPQTDFPMRAGLPQKEPEILARWEKLDLYRRLRDGAKGRTKFVLHDGPPYANGNIHIGTALNKILKDVVTRSQQMLGYDFELRAGLGLPRPADRMEDRGRELPLQEQAQARSEDSAAMLAFRQECRAFATHWLGVQREEFKRLGVTGDWDNPYTTMSFPAEAQIARELMKFAANGTLYRGSKPVMWSVVEKTALAEAEVEYEDYTSDMVWVKFPVDAHFEDGVYKDLAESRDVEGLANASIVIWTTTPWTIPGNRAISFSAKIAYGLYEVTDAPAGNWAKIGERYVLADKLAADVMKQAKVGGYSKGARCFGARTRGSSVAVIRSLALPETMTLRFRCSPAIMSPTTPAPASSTPRPATAARTSRCGPQMRATLGRATSTLLSPTRSTRTVHSPIRRQASPVRASSTTRARRAMPTRP